MKIKISLLVVLFALTAVGFYFLGTRKNNDKPAQSAAKIDLTEEKVHEKVDAESDLEIRDEGREEKEPSVTTHGKSTIYMNTVFPTDIWCWNDDAYRRTFYLVKRQFENSDEWELVSVQSLFGVTLGRDIDTYTKQFAKREIREGEWFWARDSSLFSGDIIPWNKWKVYALKTRRGHRDVEVICALYDKVVERTAMPSSEVLNKILIEMKQKFGTPLLVSSCDYVSPANYHCWVWSARDENDKQEYSIVLREYLVCGGKEWEHDLEMELVWVTGSEKWFSELKGKSDTPLHIHDCLTASYKDDVAKNLNDHVVLVHVGNGAGTGFLLRENDDSLYLYTNAHVVNADGDVKAITMDGKELSLGRVEVARRRDLARMRVYDKRTGLKLASRQPVHGDKIVILGNSDGADVSTVLKGKVLGIGPDTIEVDARFVTGNSGSPVFNAAGEVVGVATKIMYPAEEGNEKKIREGTRFDELRYFATRLDNVEWIR